jgi:hypothetical protein
MSTQPIANTVPPSVVPTYTLWQLVQCFLRLGTFGFGGPIALVGFMHRDLGRVDNYFSSLTIATKSVNSLAMNFMQIGSYTAFGAMTWSLSDMA